MGKHQVKTKEHKNSLLSNTDSFLVGLKNYSFPRWNVFCGRPSERNHAMTKAVRFFGFIFFLSAKKRRGKKDWKKRVTLSTWIEERLITRDRDFQGERQWKEKPSLFIISALLHFPLVSFFIKQIPPAAITNARSFFFTSLLPPLRDDSAAGALRINWIAELSTSSVRSTGFVFAQPHIFNYVHDKKKISTSRSVERWY